MKVKVNNFFYGGILLSSLDSFPIFSTISTYAPFFSILFFLLYLAFFRHTISFRFSGRKIIVLITIFLSFIYSFYKGISVYHDLYGFINFSTQLLLAILLYKSFNLYFINIERNKYCETFSRLFILATVPVLIVGFIELLIFPYKSLYNSFVSFFSWRVTLDRLQLISGEPAWATRLILTYLCLIPVANYTLKRKAILILVGLVLLFATGSTLGIICTGLYFLLTYFRKKYVKRYIAVLVVSIFIIPILFMHLGDYTKNRLLLLSQLGESDFATLAMSAGSYSVLARLGNPVLALHMGKDNLLCGVGGGYYYINHNEYLDEYFPQAYDLGKVSDGGVTAKNLMARIFAEMGLLGLAVLLFAIFYLYKNKVKKQSSLRGIFIIMLLLTINFDSLFHVYPLLLFCFLLNLPANKELEFLR